MPNVLNQMLCQVTFKYNQMMILIQQFRPIHFRASDISRKKKQNFAGFSHFYSISTDKKVT